MSDLLPLFPLPNVVLFPNVFLPLHIFEPRYREMVADAVASDRLIGMVLLRPVARAVARRAPGDEDAGVEGPKGIERRALSAAELTRVRGSWFQVRVDRKLDRTRYPTSPHPAAARFRDDRFRRAPPPGE